MGEHVGCDEARSSRASRIRHGPLDAGDVRVDARDLEAATGKVERQQPVAAPDVERVHSPGRNRSEDHTVVMDVQIPAGMPWHALMVDPRVQPTVAARRPPLRSDAPGAGIAVFAHVCVLGAGDLRSEPGMRGT